MVNALVLLRGIRVEGGPTRPKQAPHEPFSGGVVGNFTEPLMHDLKSPLRAGVGQGRRLDCGGIERRRLAGTDRFAGQPVDTSGSGSKKLR